ncbi:hypothetical protein COLINT_03301 [Collinsella intestinalis DSM 13280]|uniref:Uncharacterized protein n=1 Tax=Collinsella intestinalis DSM 13280 TaxID=521003 RepID=C4FB51_9ACTN|nr:hypothetical protein [Collinsella intestinalis]EEP44051.1 hypothetical protein COLINT_03301 [Collinsella intestinalis DSM 13280]
MEMIWSVWGDFFNASPTISESHGPSGALLILPIEPHQDIASGSSEDEQRIRHGENDVLRCFESTGAELGVGDVMAMLPGISKRTAQKRLKALFEKGEVAAVKRAALSCTSRSSFRPDATFANRSYSPPLGAIAIAGPLVYTAADTAVTVALRDDTTLMLV